MPNSTSPEPRQAAQGLALDPQPELLAGPRRERSCAAAPRCSGGRNSSGVSTMLQFVRHTGRSTWSARRSDRPAGPGAHRSPAPARGSHPAAGRACRRAASASESTGSPRSGGSPAGSSASGRSLPAPSGRASPGAARRDRSRMRSPVRLARSAAPLRGEQRRESAAGRWSSTKREQLLLAGRALGQGGEHLVRRSCQQPAALGHLLRRNRDRARANWQARARGDPWRADRARRESCSAACARLSQRPSARQAGR